MPKKLKEGPLSLARYFMLRGKKEKPFLLFPGPTGTILNFVELLVKLFWRLQVYRKKTLTKSHD